MAVEAVLKVMSSGLLTSVQDLGRFGFGKYGVAPSGALDPFAMRVANLLVGNSESEAGLETTLLGLRLAALTDTVVAVSGADLQAAVDRKPAPMWQSFVLRKGSVLSLSGPREGCRAYVAVAGGLAVPSIMNSCSTNLSSGFGGLEGRGLKSGDVLQANRTSGSLPVGVRLEPGSIPNYADRPFKLRVIRGPQNDDFLRAEYDTLLGSTYTASSDMDRTGIRLQGPAVQPRQGAPESIISEGVLCGAIQVPGDGQPIIILGETVTGGYRKIATVISADLPLLGQIKPGDGIRFEAVSIDRAVDVFRAAEKVILDLKTRIDAGMPPPGD